jgi:hypothetical protein
MAEKILTGAGLLVDGYDFSAQTNQIDLQYNQEILDRTSILTTSRNRVPGLFDGNFSATLFWDADVDSTAATQVPVDSILFGKIGGTKAVCLVGDAGFTTGNTVYFSRFVVGNNSKTDSVGELVTQTVEFQGKSKINSGESGYYSTAVTNTSTEGPGVSLAGVGGLTSTQTLYAAFALDTSGLAGVGVTVKVVGSTDHTNFAASTTRITFSTRSTRDSLVSSVPGPITDTGFRFEISTTVADNYVLAAAFSVE